MWCPDGYVTIKEVDRICFRIAFELWPPPIQNSEGTDDSEQNTWRKLSTKQNVTADWIFSLLIADEGRNLFVCSPTGVVLQLGRLPLVWLQYQSKRAADLNLLPPNDFDYGNLTESFGARTLLFLDEHTGIVKTRTAMQRMQLKVFRMLWKVPTFLKLEDAIFDELRIFNRWAVCMRKADLPHDKESMLHFVKGRLGVRSRHLVDRI